MRLFDQIERAAGRYALLGFSTGALVAYELACTLTAAGLSPVHLFAASQAAPWHVTAAADPLLPDAQLVDRLRALGWIPEEIAEAGANVWEVVLPLYRADLELERTYAWGTMRAAAGQRRRAWCGAAASG